MPKNNSDDNKTHVLQEAEELFLKKLLLHCNGTIKTDKNETVTTPKLLQITVSRPSSSLHQQQTKVSNPSGSTSGTIIASAATNDVKMVGFYNEATTAPLSGTAIASPLPGGMHNHLLLDDAHALKQQQQLLQHRVVVCSPDIMAATYPKQQPQSVQQLGTTNKQQQTPNATATPTEDPYKCNICSKTFAVPARLTRHYRTHTGEKPFRCEFCDKSFSVKENLSVHRRIHTKERPYKCDVCARAFEHSGKLHRHMRIHTGERPHRCTVCAKTFIQSGQLVIHMRTHTGEKPYVCTVCQKGFTCSKQLKVHSRTHTGEKPYACEICGKSFGYNHVLKLHQVAHYGEKVYKCTICNDTFTSKKSMEAHIKSHAENTSASANNSSANSVSSPASSTMSEPPSPLPQPPVGSITPPPQSTTPHSEMSSCSSMSSAISCSDKENSMHNSKHEPQLLQQQQLLSGVVPAVMDMVAHDLIEPPPISYEHDIRYYLYSNAHAHNYAHGVELLAAAASTQPQLAVHNNVPSQQQHDRIIKHEPSEHHQHQHQLINMSAMTSLPISHHNIDTHMSPLKQQHQQSYAMVVPPSPSSDEDELYVNGVLNLISHHRRAPDQHHQQATLPPTPPSMNYLMPASAVHLNAGDDIRKRVEAALAMKYDDEEDDDNMDLVMANEAIGRTDSRLSLTPPSSAPVSPAPSISPQPVEHHHMMMRDEACLPPRKRSRMLQRQMEITDRESAIITTTTTPPAQVAPMEVPVRHSSVIQFARAS